MPVQLREAYLFATLDEAQLKQVESSCHLVRLDDGQNLFQVGDEARRFFLVKEGKIKLYRLSVEGDEKVIEVVRAGGTFAEALMFMEQPRYPVSASALGKTELWAIDNRGFLDLLP
jgi:CRP/FNR family transcriptional regulator, dissimilatory nitrate respiration regulator